MSEKKDVEMWGLTNVVASLEFRVLFARHDAEGVRTEIITLEVTLNKT